MRLGVLTRRVLATVRMPSFIEPKRIKLSLIKEIRQKFTNERAV